MTEAEERVLDVALEEVLGGAAPPDLSGRIAESLGGRGVAARPGGPPQARRRVAMAASLLLCAGVIWMVVQQETPTERARSLVAKLRSERVGERDEAVRRLKEIGKEAAAELEKAAGDPDPEVAGRAANVLRWISISSGLTENLKRAIPSAADRLAAGGDPAWTELLLEAAGRHPSLAKEDLQPLAAAALRGAGTPEERDRLWPVIERFSLRSAEPEIVKLLGARFGLERARAACALGSFGARTAVPKLVPLLEDADSDARDAAAWALGTMGAPESSAGLIARLKDEDVFVRKQAAWALGRLRSREAVPHLVPLLKDAGLGLYEPGSPIGSVSTAPALVCDAAGGALVRLKAREALPDLVKLLDDGGEEVRLNAVRVLVELGARDQVPAHRKKELDAVLLVSCANHLSQLWKFQYLFMATEGGPPRAMRRETGSEFWTALSKAKSLGLEEASELFRCPASDRRKGCSYWGPGTDINAPGAFADDDPVGMCDDPAHGGRVVILRMAGDTLSYPGDDTLVKRAREVLKPPVRE